MKGCLAMVLALGACCPVDGAPDPGTCSFPGSSGVVTVTYEGEGYGTPTCWEAAGGAGQEGLIESDNIAFGGAALDLAVVFYANQQNEVTQAACPWQAGMTVPLSSNCLSVTATGTSAFIATAGDQAAAGTLVPTGTLTLEAWPGDAGGPLSISFSPDAQLLYLPALNGTTGDAGLLPISGTATGVSIGPVSAGDSTSD
jgi:hypothetical protein